MSALELGRVVLAPDLRVIVNVHESGSVSLLWQHRCVRAEAWTLTREQAAELAGLLRAFTAPAPVERVAARRAEFASALDRVVDTGGSEDLVFADVAAEDLRRLANTAHAFANAIDPARRGPWDQPHAVDTPETAAAMGEGAGSVPRSGTHTSALCARLALPLVCRLPRNHVGVCRPNVGVWPAGDGR